MTQNSSIPFTGFQVASPWNSFMTNETLAEATFAGKWGLSSMKCEGESEFMTEDFTYTFSGQGNYSLKIKNKESVTLVKGKTFINTENNTITLNMEGESLVFNIIKLSALEMVLRHEASELEYFFLKNN